MSFPTLRRLLLLLSLTPLMACGGGSVNPPPPNPIFTSTPPSAAAEGTLYSYTPQATDPAGGTVSFALSSRPGGATFSAGSLSWIPTPEESRVPDQFTITATSSEGGTARQTWNVVPSGSVSGTWIDTYWTPDGSVDVPINWATFGLTPQALIPQSDGSIITLNATVNSDGAFNIAGVPGGYFWFRFGSNSFWTSSSQIDFGADISGRRLTTVPTQQTTTFDFTVDGLNPVQTSDQFAFLTDLANPFNIGFPIPAAPGSTAMNTFYSTNTNLDFSAAHTGFLLQYEPVAAGSVTGIALGPELTIEDLSITNGSVNNLPGTLHSSGTTSFDLSVKGSEWAAAFQNVTPGTALPVDAYINVFAQPYIDANVLASTARFDLNIPLFLPDLRSTSSGFLLSWPGAGSCVDSVQFQALQIAAYPAILSDQDFGTLAYQDPFPSEWKRVFSLCQTASFNMPIPGSGATAPVLFGTGQNTAVPISPVSPLILPVSNPKMNGASLFTAATISPIGLTLSWTQPTGLTPYAYKIALFTLRPQGDGTFNYFPAGTFTTGKTNATLPPLQSGQTYVFAISARIDGKADVEKSPNRSALPTAYATVISAPITMD